MIVSAAVLWRDARKVARLVLRRIACFYAFRTEALQRADFMVPSVQGGVEGDEVHDHGRGVFVTSWFVTRHPGALDWARSHGINDAKPVEHLNVGHVVQGDCVLGTLPVHLAAEVCARGARYLHLSLDIPEDRRGSELSAEDMEAFGARLEEYRIERVEC